MSKFTTKNAALVACALFVCAASGMASATTQVTVAATKVRVQNFAGGGTALFYTGSACGTGSLVLDPNDTLDRHKLLLATTLAAKAMNATMFFDYDIGANDQCVIRSFAVDGP